MTASDAVYLHRRAYWSGVQSGERPNRAARNARKALTFGETIFFGG
jgi:hypothetical protein